VHRYYEYSDTRKRDRSRNAENPALLLLAAAILSIQVISDFRVDERRGISSCLRRGDEAEVTIRYFLSVAQERGSEHERTFIVREKEEARQEKEEAPDGEGGTRKEQIEEEGITVPSFFGPADSCRVHEPCRPN